MQHHTTTPNHHHQHPSVKRIGTHPHRQPAPSAWLCLLVLVGYRRVQFTGQVPCAHCLSFARSCAIERAPGSGRAGPGAEHGVCALHATAVPERLTPRPPAPRPPPPQAALPSPARAHRPGTWPLIGGEVGDRDAHWSAVPAAPTCSHSHVSWKGDWVYK